MIFRFQKDTKDTYDEAQDNPWAGLPYTIDLETGKCKLILWSGSRVYSIK